MNRRLFFRLLPFLGAVPLAAKLKPPAPSEVEDLRKMVGFYRTALERSLVDNSKLLAGNLHMANDLVPYLREWIKHERA